MGVRATAPAAAVPLGQALIRTARPRPLVLLAYAFERIIVMERVLGGYLLPDESVHHLNGIRDRPENLELWPRPQPTRIRVSDAVAWAREIIARYEGSTITSNNAQDFR